MTGVRLIKQHPKIALRSCTSCQKWQYNDKTGEIEKWNGEPALRDGPPPCFYSDKVCPKVSPTANIALSPKNQRAYEHYLKCQAVNRFPEDTIVERNAAVIRMVEDAIKAQEREDWIRSVR